MSDEVAVKRGDSLFFWCPGCDDLHSVSVKLWEWDGDLIAPTISPSILVQGSVHMCPATYEHYELCEDPENCGAVGHVLMEDDKQGHMRKHVAEPPFGNCHSFLRNGQWEFLGDSTHKLAGKNAQMVPLPVWVTHLSGDKE